MRHLKKQKQKLSWKTFQVLLQEKIRDPVSILVYIKRSENECQCIQYRFGLSQTEGADTFSDYRTSLSCIEGKPLNLKANEFVIDFI